MMKYSSFLLVSLSSIVMINSAYASLGEETATALNSHYNRTQECSFGEPAYACSGVLIHTFDKEAKESRNGWMPTPSGVEKGRVSFSWLRNDINIYHEDDSLGSIYPGEGDITAGLIFETTNRAIIYGNIPSEIYCAYGVNGETKSRNDFGCSMNLPNVTIPNENNYSSCQPLGVNKAEQLVEKYFINKEGIYQTGSIDQCSFSSDKSEFIEAMRVGPLAREYMLTPLRNNEVVLKEWSEVSDIEVPISAFFYTLNYLGSSELGKQQAQTIQLEYFETTGEIKPIIAVDMHIIKEGNTTKIVEPFIYIPEDQSPYLNIEEKL